MRKKVSALALTGLAMLSGCGTTTASSVSTAGVAKAAKARVITVATPGPTSPAPALATTGASWMPIVKSLSAYGQWLLANPDPALVGNVATPGCAVGNMLAGQVDGLLGSGAHVRTAPAVISSVLGPATVVGDRVVLDVVAARPAEPVLSRTGARTISTFDAFPQSALQVTLDRGADRRWRFCSIESQADHGATDDPSVPLI